MYWENMVEIPQKIAGLLLSAILSDTLMFRSPTSTPIDERVAHELAKIAGVDIEDYASQMFEAGSNIEGKTAQDIFMQDFKVFKAGDTRYGLSLIHIYRPVQTGRHAGHHHFQPTWSRLVSYTAAAESEPVPAVRPD